MAGQLRGPFFYALGTMFPVANFRLYPSSPPAHHYHLAPAVDMPLDRWREHLASLAPSPELAFRAAADPKWDRYEPDDYATLHPATRTLAFALFERLNAVDVDDSEQEVILAHIALLRAGHYGNFTSQPALVVREYFVEVLRSFVAAEEAAVDASNDIEVDMLNDILAPFRALQHHFINADRSSLNSAAASLPPRRICSQKTWATPWTS